MVDGRRRGLAGRAPFLAIAAAFGGLILGVVNLPLARAATSSASSGGGGLPSSSACSDVAERCAADPFCAGCTTAAGGRRRERSRRRMQQQSGNDTDDGSSLTEEEVAPELCSSRYPVLASGSGISFCERVGAAACCTYSDNDAALACLDDPLSAEYWDCFVMDVVDCVLSDMPCHASFRAAASLTVAPTAAPVLMTTSPTATPTSAPTAAPTPAPAATVAPTEAAATSSPTAGSRGGLGDIPTAAPTAVADAGDVEADDADAEDTSGGTARMFARGGTVLAGVVVAVGGALLPGALLGMPLAQ